jgi:hypothetical protein
MVLLFGLLVIPFGVVSASSNVSGNDPVTTLSFRQD